MHIITTYTNHPVMGKSEGKGELWHGHVTAVTVAPEYRRLGKVRTVRKRGGTKPATDAYSVFVPSPPTHTQAKTLMALLEAVSEKSYNAFFVDLFVRVSNALAISMYKRFGYSVYRQVLGYYSGEEDAYGACCVCVCSCILRVFSGGEGVRDCCGLACLLARWS